MCQENQIPISEDSRKSILQELEEMTKDGQLPVPTNEDLEPVAI
jgi:hypothetical protein